MNIFSFLKKREINSSPDFFSSKEDNDFISTASAMRLSAVYACINLLAQTISTLPFNIFRRTPTGSKKASEHALWRLFSIAPKKQITLPTSLK